MQSGIQLALSRGLQLGQSGQAVLGSRVALGEEHLASLQEKRFGVPTPPGMYNSLKFCARALLVGTALALVCCVPALADERPNIVVIWGMTFTDAYGQQSCTAGRAAFITGQSPLRTGLLKVGLPGAKEGLHREDVTLAELLKPLGHATGQFGENHLGDLDEHLPTNHGFDEFFGNLYHLNAEEEPENPDYFKREDLRKKFGPRGGIHSFAGGPITDTGPLTKKRMETIDREVLEKTFAFLDQRKKDNKQFFV